MQRRSNGEHTLFVLYFFALSPSKMNLLEEDMYERYEKKIISVHPSPINGQAELRRVFLRS